MNRLAPAIVAALLAGLLVLGAAPASATFHEQVVNEVMLADGTGSPSVQFVELFDPVPEPFPAGSGPYDLTVYDGAGSPVFTQPLTAAGMAAASAGHRPYLISTSAADAAFMATGDQVLGGVLPQAAGQACYRAEGGGFIVSCLTWGTISAFASCPASSQGPAIPSGKSAQRQTDGSVLVGDPTPGQPNVVGTGTSGVGCGSSTFTGVSLAGHRAKVRRGRARVPLRCPATSGGCSGRLTLTARAGTTAASVKLGSARFKLAAGVKRTVKVPLTRRATRLLATRRRLRARARIVARDAAGQSKTTSGKLVLVR